MAIKKSKSKALGKGLGALIPTDVSIENSIKKPDTNKSGIVDIKLSDITPNKDQPREIFDEEKLKELALSIKSVGLIEPIIVSRAKKGYELIAGERRWRASKIAGFKTIPAIIPFCSICFCAMSNCSRWNCVLAKQATVAKQNATKRQI